MVQPGGIGLDTPRTNAGDATFLSSHNLDFEISQELSFQSPNKDNDNLMQQLQNGRRGGTINLKTPRGRAALHDRRNLPAGEFTPLIKNATLNSAKRSGKENIPKTPGFHKSSTLHNIPEDFSPLPQIGSSVYGRESRNGSYMSSTPMPRMQTSSAASTPMALLPRRTEGPGVLQDGNQMSLREQENVIDKIEKENFGLKLKIHFLEDALRKAGPGFSEAALKENTELKVDKVTMQKELQKYRKTLTVAERDVELFRQQMLEMQEKMKRKHADASQQAELDRLRQKLEEKEDELDRLQRQENQFGDLQDKVHDLEADLREKDRLLDDQDDEVENMKDDLVRKSETISELEESLKKAQRREIELEEAAESKEDIADAKEAYEDLEREMKRLKEDLEDAKEGQQEAMREKERAEADLEELQDEMANKSVTTKGLSRQIQEKAERLQDEVENLQEKNETLAEGHGEKVREVNKIREKLENLERDGSVREQSLKDQLELAETHKQSAVRDLATKLDAVQKDLRDVQDDKNLLQIRHDALTTESATLQRDLTRCQTLIEDLGDQLNHEKTLALDSERQIRDEYKVEIDRLSDDLQDMEAEAREKDRLYEQNRSNWDTERRNLESQKRSADEKAASLQQAIDRLQQAEGNLSSKEKKLQQSLESEKERHKSQESSMTRQINELNDDLRARRESLEQVRVELTSVREELRLSTREQNSLAEKVEALEDEVEILQTSLDDETDRSNEEIAAAKQDSESLRRQLQSLKLELAKAEAAAADAKAEIQAFQGDLQAGEGSKEQLSSRLRDVEVQLSQVREERRGLKEQLATLTGEINTLRNAKVDAEAERDEVKSELRSIKRQEEETFRLDEEKVDLRTSKMKLDAEVRRLKEENKVALAAQQSLEKELQQELDRATLEETRLNSEVHDLQRILRGSAEKKELAASKKTIHQLESRIHELEAQLASGDSQADVTSELSLVRRDLATARSKETEYLQREATQKETMRTLKRQISDLESKVHEAELARLTVASPRSSFIGSARKSELFEIRHQLSTTHETLRDLRSQLKNTEREASRNLNAANTELREKTEAWEAEKDKLERTLDEALLKRDQLTAQNNTSEATISRLRSKIDRLEQALQAERLNTGEDRTIAMERHDLHEMLRESQVQVESLEVIVRERESAISSINAAAEKMNKNIARIREERDLQKTKAESAKSQLKELESKYKVASELWAAEKSPRKSDHNGNNLVEERDMHRAKAEAAGKRLTELELKLKNFSSIKSTTERLKTNIERIRAERDDLLAHVERSHVRIASLQQDIKKAMEGWEAEKQLGKDVERLRKERDDLREAQKSHEEQLAKLESQASAKGVSTTTTTVTEKQSTEIRRVREERDRFRAQAETTTKQLEDMEHKLHEATEIFDSDRLTITHGLEFPNMAISINDEEVQLLNQIEILKASWTNKESVHVKTMRGLQMQIDWWRAKYNREATFRDMGTYAKKYMKLQIEMFEACNKADLALLRTIPGLASHRPAKPNPAKPTIRKVALLVRAILRMKKGAAAWGEKQKMKEVLEATFTETEKASRKLAEKRLVEKRESERAREEREMKGVVEKRLESIKRKASLRVGQKVKTTKTTEVVGAKRKSSVK